MQLFLNRLLTAVILALMAAPAFAQKENQRYEVGRRLIKFEVDFEGIKDPLILKGISERLKPLTFYFFSGQLDQCAKALDRRRCCVAGGRGHRQSRRPSGLVEFQM